MRALLLGALLLPALGHGAQCSAESGSATAALVELYTAQECSSCPAAERWLSTLSRHSSGLIVPLTLHVDYGEYVGVAPRKRKLTARQRMALVYTPQVLLQGREVPAWHDKDFDVAMAAVQSRPARAMITLSIVGVDARGLEVDVAAEVLDPTRETVLFLAAYRSKPEATLVLEWQGPFALSGRHEQRIALPLLPGAAPESSGVVAFVQDRRTGEVLQALQRSSC